MDLRDIDILNPDLYAAAGPPHAQFARLRREAPVYWHPEVDGPGLWAVTRYKDVVAVLRDPATFSSERAGVLIPNFPPGDARASPDVLINMDPPKHTRYRALVGKGFLPRIIQRAEAQIRALVVERIEAALARGGCDFANDIAGDVPLRVILEIIGIPAEHRAQMLEWTRRFLGSDDPEFALSPPEFGALMANMMGYAHRLAAERRGAPQDDMLSLLMAAEVDGEHLKYEEFGLFFTLLLTAGHETTRNLIVNGTLALLENPEQRERLVADPSLVPSAVEEMLRMSPSGIHFRRTATCDTELAGQKIAEGSKVVVWLVSANRDEEVFAHPDVFDVARTPNEHLSFGLGPHFCLGASLGRLEARIAFEELLRRVGTLELAGPVERLRSNWVNGIKRMPVRLTARAGS